MTTPPQGEPIMNPASVGRWWNRRAILSSTAEPGGLSVAVWDFEVAPVTELEGEADPQTHIICVGVSGDRTQTYFGDGKRRFHNQTRTSMVNIVPAGERPRALLQGDRPFSAMHLYVSVASLRTLAERTLGGAAASSALLMDPCGVPDPELDRMARVAMAEMRHGGPVARLRLDVLGQELGIHLLRRYSPLAERLRHTPEPVRGGLATWRLKRACDAMDARLDGEIGLEMLAQVAGCSPTHFSRAFKVSMGVSPFAWLSRRRIERAQALMGDRSLSLAEIALSVGFSAQPQFTTAFKRATGLTPGAWRASARS